MHYSDRQEPTLGSVNKNQWQQCNDTDEGILSALHSLKAERR